MTDSSKPRRRTPSLPAAARLLPAGLLQVPIGRLVLPAALAAALQQHDVQTTGDLLALPARTFGPNGWLAADDAEALQRSLGRLLREGLATCDPIATADAYRDLRDELLGCLDEDERCLVAELIGLDAPPVSRLDAAHQRTMSLQALEDRTEQARARVHQTASALLGRLRYEVGRDIAAGHGLLPAGSTSDGSLLQLVANGSNDPLLGARLVSFFFPREFVLHREILCGTAPRTLRRLLRQLPMLVPPQRLPLSVTTLEQELAAEQVSVPRGLLVHLLRVELRVEIEADGEGTDVIVPDPRSASTRLVDLLLDLGRPTQLDELVYAFRDRFRRASRRRIEQRLRSNPAFVLLGPTLWSLRRWHLEELEAVAPLVDRVARRVCSTGERQRVAVLLSEEHASERQVCLVLDRLAVDPRVRLLGRGEVCPATHQQSRVLEQLLADFRRAAGDVVTSMFLHNQPPARRRLVERLLRWNRLFVTPAADRIDLLSNYPFNDERMRRLLNLVGHQLEQHDGRVSIATAKDVLDGTDLGGNWLSTTLLADLLRRHGSFELLGCEVVCRRELRLGSSLLRTVRQALRCAGQPLSVDEILQARPELSAFANCLHELIADDPLLQTPDGAHFTLV